MPRIIAGVDEAGRGPVVGPMVIAAVAVPEDSLEEWRSAGIRDSKKLSRRRREALAESIRAAEGIRIAVSVATPADIDAAVSNRSVTLNGLTLNRMAEVIGRVDPDAALLDLVGHSGEKMALSLLRLLPRPIPLEAKARADASEVVVGAASIIAKTERDRLLDELTEELGGRFGPVGSGYPSDPATRAFLARAWRHAPHVFRTSWSSYQDARDTVPAEA